MKYCIHCGNQVEGKAFCDKCGKPTGNKPITKSDQNNETETVITKNDALNFTPDKDTVSEKIPTQLAEASMAQTATNEKSEASPPPSAKRAVLDTAAITFGQAHGSLPSTGILNACGIELSDICYCVKILTVTNRKIHNSSGTFSGILSNISTTVSDVISSTMHSTYLVRTCDGNVQLVSEKPDLLKFQISELKKENSSGSGLLNFSVWFPMGSIENILFKLTIDNFNNAFYGNLLQLLADFNTSSDFPFNKASDGFLHILHYPLNTYGTLYPFTSAQRLCSLVLFCDDGIYLYECGRKIEYKNIVAHHLENGYALYLVAENNNLEMFEISQAPLSPFSNSDFNLIRAPRNTDSNLKFKSGEASFNADSFLTVLKCEKLCIVSVDTGIYAFKNSKLSECGLFLIENNVYVKTADGETVKYENSSKITEGITLLPCNSDKLLSNKTELQPFVLNGEITNFSIDDECIKSENECFYYKYMKNYHYVTEDFSCTLTFNYDGRDIKLTTSNSLGVLISNTQEKVFVTAETASFDIANLYKIYYKRSDKNFLASTFAEIFKTLKFLNNDYEIKDLIHASLANENAVLRSTFKSLLGNFTSIDDLQSIMLQKVTVLEIQRKKIQKMCDEWLLYYPHYAAAAQVDWLNTIFGPHISKTTLKLEYQRCVSFFKRMLTGYNTYIQKYMDEIAKCIAPLYPVLPDDVKRIDVTSSLRINPYSKEKLLSAGGDALVGISTAIEIVNSVSDGFNVSNPLMLSMSVKSVIDSYLKDTDMRKDIKAFGLQALEWWEIFIKGIYIQTLELSNAFEQYNNLCLQRDSKLLEALPEDIKEAVSAKLASKLRAAIISGIDDKFTEILPQFNMRISNVIEEIESNKAFWGDTLGDFKHNLFI